MAEPACHSLVTIRCKVEAYRDELAVETCYDSIVPILRALLSLYTELSKVSGPKTWAGSRQSHRVWKERIGRSATQQGTVGCLSLAERAVHQRLGRAVAMAMDQPKKGLESKLLDKAGS